MMLRDINILVIPNPGRKDTYYISITDNDKVLYNIDIAANNENLLNSGIAQVFKKALCKQLA